MIAALEDYDILLEKYNNLVEEHIKSKDGLNREIEQLQKGDY